MQMDAVALEMDDDPRLQRETADRFGRYFSGDSLRDITLCAPVEPDLRARADCWLRDDFKCLAKLARLAKDSIPFHYGDGER